MLDKNTTQQMSQLIDIMTKLRAPSGCPWDREQTPESLKPHILEEAYEVIEAIDRADSREICDELGDLLLQVVFIAQIFSEQNQFDFADIANSITTKLIRRHPHVFGNSDSTNHAQQWEKIKQQERNEKGQGDKLADRIPRNLPALKKAAKVSKKMDRVVPDELIQKLLIRIKNISEFSAGEKRSHVEQEFSETFFNLVQLTQQFNLDAEDLLRKKTTQVINEIDAE